MKTFLTLALILLLATSAQAVVRGYGHEFMWNGDFEDGDFLTGNPENNGDQNWSWDANVNAAIITDTPPST